MRYLKLFNENLLNRTELDELQDFCETHLVYLLDGDYRIEIDGGISFTIFKFSKLPIVRNGENIVQSFKWNDIKDHFIPFCSHLQDQYELGTSSTRINTGINIQYFSKRYKDESIPPNMNDDWFNELSLRVHRENIVSLDQILSDSISVVENGMDYIWEIKIIISDKR
jgi:hypothetical protein